MKKNNFFKRIISNFIFLKNKIFLNKYEKEFIKFNLKKWPNKKNQKKRGIVLIDLFYWSPWIYFWSYLASFLGNKKKLDVKFFYFHFFFFYF